MKRRIALLTNERRQATVDSAAAFERRLLDAEFGVIRVAETLPEEPVELVVVMGGDGTILKAAEIFRCTDTPILGINYGHVGFLAEAEPSSLREVVDAILERDWTVDKRMTIDITLHLPDGSIVKDWALNEASVEKGPQSRMIETALGVDGRAVSSFKTDAVLVSTPTGSTAYSYSAGGPVVWPDVEALLLTPIAAHALFTRPMVVGPQSTLSIGIRSDSAVIWCDGRRAIDAPEGSMVTAVRGEHPVLLARINDTPFSGRLVKKFHLPVHGWRVPPEEVGRGVAVEGPFTWPPQTHSLHQPSELPLPESGVLGTQEQPEE